MAASKRIGTGDYNVSTQRAGNVNISTGYVNIDGNLIVSGNVTTVSTTTLDVTDKNITLASNATSNTQVDGAGITVFYANAQLDWIYDAADPQWGHWQFNKNVSIANNGYYFGNGSQLTGLNNYSNVNVAAYLPTHTGNIQLGSNVANSNVMLSVGTVGGGGTGLYVKAASTQVNELITKQQALVYALIFG